MSVWNNANQIFVGTRGVLVSKAYPTMAVETKDLFTITGGRCLVTMVFAIATTALTVADTVKLQAAATAGGTNDLFAATDLGTTDTVVGELVSFTGLATDTAVRGGAAAAQTRPIVVQTGKIQQVTTGAGADGGLTWYLSYVAIDDGAAIAAA